MILKQNNESGYIVVFVLLLLSLLTIIVTRISWHATTLHIVNSTAAAQEKAKSLALSSMAIAYSQLSILEVVPEAEENSDKKPPQETQKITDNVTIWMKSILPSLNRRQTFPLTKELDGVTGSIDICISCEQGKLDINTMYDFKEKKFAKRNGSSDEMRALVQQFFVLLKPKINNRDLFPALEKYLQARGAPFDDVTQLLEIKEFAEAFSGSLFYEAPSTATSHTTLFLTDLFTLFSGEQGINPLVLSDSWCGLLSLNRAKDNEIGDRTKHFVQIFEKEGATAAKGGLETVWNKLLKKPYGKEFKQIDTSAQKYCGPIPLSHFSIFIAVTIDGITQKIFAIIEKREHDKKDTRNLKELFYVKRLYWV